MVSPVNHVHRDQCCIQDPKHLYSLNPGFHAAKGEAVGDGWFFSHLSMRGNGTFHRSDLTGAALDAHFAGARAIWDLNVCGNTQSSHMCIGPCDAWQPRDPKTGLPILEPVW